MSLPLSQLAALSSVTIVGHWSAPPTPSRAVGYFGSERANKAAQHLQMLALNDDLTGEHQALAELEQTLEKITTSLAALGGVYAVPLQK